jgi:hypothetical protein
MSHRPTKKVVYVLAFFFVAIFLPISAYFVSQYSDDFDIRNEAAGATYTVCPKAGTGCDFVGGDGIQAAINVATDNDTILLKADTTLTTETKYTRSVYSEFVFDDSNGTKHKKVFLNLMNKTITIRAEDKVMLDGSVGPEMTGLGKSGYKTATIENLIISGFKKESDCNDRETFCGEGRGTQIAENGSLIFRNSKIISNADSGILAKGNGLLVLLSTTISGNGLHGIVAGNYMVLDITSSSISNNGTDSSASGFFMANDVTMTITGSVVKENGLSGIQAQNRTKVTAANNLIVSNPEHGIDLADTTTLAATNNTIANNEKMGIKLGCGGNSDSNPAVSLVNNIIANNSGDVGIGGDCSVGAGKTSNDTFSYTLLWGNKYDNTECTDSHLCATNCGTAGCTGMIWDKDPLFTSVSDYHLKTGSPAINAGISALKDPDGSQSDMGAYGGPKACKLDDTLPGCTGACVPVCTGKVCGSNGCSGGSCGICPTGQSCNSSGQCISGTCTPNCTGKTCGSDGCTGTCGICQTGQTCNSSGTCITGGELPGDLDGDGEISVSDYALFVSDYLAYKSDGTVNPRSDFNEDDSISVSDYALFIQYYLDFKNA